MTNHDFSHAKSIEFAKQLAELLASKQLRIVLAESCTAGNVAGALAMIPGISNWLCGSFVVYRNDSKHQWLGIPSELLNDPTIGPVSIDVTMLLSKNALQKTPEAEVAAAITGHVGPGCPAELDGKIYLSIASREHQEDLFAEYRLTSPAPHDASDIARRQTRMHEATCWVMQTIIKCISGSLDG